MCTQHYWYVQALMLHSFGRHCLRSACYFPTSLASYIHFTYVRAILDEVVFQWLTKLVRCLDAMLDFRRPLCAIQRILFKTRSNVGWPLCAGQSPCRKAWPGVASPLYECQSPCRPDVSRPLYVNQRRCGYATINIVWYMCKGHDHFFLVNVALR